MEIATSRALQDKLYDKRKGGALEYVIPYACCRDHKCGQGCLQWIWKLAHWIYHGLQWPV
jgi:hypothetical protein